MIGLDTNVVVYAMVSSLPEHEDALKWFRKNTEPLVLSPVSVGETLRLLTHPKVFRSALSLKVAVNLFKSFLDDFKITVLDEDLDWWTQLPELLKDFSGLRGNAIYDARIALCFKYHGVKQIYTNDAEFKKYSFLKVLGISH